ncbi:hypothetical protein MAE02_40530 [Microvirga aerophila]|uniref:Uncharacterized protein n=1 Tax=Microvirga aerophila TaxID=670291 RepID=A0A512BWX4_9HYPH|nr:hypothetical protein MAE02_40530 [Microvirga aerophila]
MPPHDVKLTVADNRALQVQFPCSDGAGQSDSVMEARPSRRISSEIMSERVGHPLLRPSPCPSRGDLNGEAVLHSIPVVAALRARDVE